MKTILYIEEKQAICEIFTILFSSLNDFFKVLAVDTVDKAVEILAKIKPDAVLTGKQLDAAELSLLQDHLKPQKDVRLITLVPDNDNTLALLKIFDASHEIRMPVDSALLINTLCDALGLDYGGQIKGFSLASFLQMIELEGKTCTLKILSDRKTGWIYCLAGEIIAASIENWRGKEAAFKILCMENPLISVEYGIPRVTRDIHSPLMSLLLESGRIQDEQEDRIHERRRHSRCVCASPVEIEYNQRVHHCIANNLSLSGVFLITRDPLPIDEIVSISFFSHSLTEKCSLEGTIVRKTRDGIGIAFTDLDVQQKAFLAKVVEEAVAI